MLESVYSIPMLEFKDYIADWPDLPYRNFCDYITDFMGQWKDNNALFHRSGKQTEFTIWKYQRLAEECQRIGRGLLASGLKKGDRVGLWGDNQPEWIAVWLGTVIAGCIIVPIDYLSSEAETLNIITLTKVKAFFYAGRKGVFADSLASQGVSLNALVCLDYEESEGRLSYSDFGRDAGTVALPSREEIASEDPASIVFSSGTTGFAKGITLSHGAIIANVNGARLSLRAYPWDVFVNVLPLHHTYPTMCSFLAPLAFGSAILIVDKLVGKVVIDDIRDAGGTFLIAVPLLYDKVMAALDQGYQTIPGIVRGPLDILRKVALDKANKGNYQFGQRVFKFFRKKAGLASIRIMVAGGGPLNIKTANFFDSLGFNIVHGYGMSENSPLVTVNTPWHKRNASVGLPIKDTYLRILDTNEDGIGEICVKSPSIMNSYYENPEATKEVFTEDGWLLTGDLGYIDKDGFLYISGRKKNLIVNSGGKNVHPEEVESHFNGSAVIGEILVLGRKETDSNSEQVFAVVVPNAEALAERYPSQAADDAFVRDLVKKEIEQVNRTLVGYKKICDFTLRREPFEKNAQQKIRRFLYKEYENL